MNDMKLCENQLTHCLKSTTFWRYSHNFSGQILWTSSLFILAVFPSIKRTSHIFCPSQSKHHKTLSIPYLLIFPTTLKPSTALSSKSSIYLVDFYLTWLWFIWIFSFRFAFYLFSFIFAFFDYFLYFW